MLMFFPTPYPDENWYSLLCRYYVRSVHASYSAAVCSLFERPLYMSPLIYLPLHMDRVESWLRPDVPFHVEDMTRKYSCIQYFSITYDTPVFETAKILADTGSIERGSPAEWSLIRRLGAYMDTPLCCCPKCAEEDITKYGETYWHRTHQLPDIYFCDRHGLPLLKTKAQIRRAGRAFLPASAIVDMEARLAEEKKANLRFPDQHKALAQDAAWLLEHGLQLGGARAISEKYVALLKKSGLATPNGQGRPKLIRQALIDYHGEDFLHELHVHDTSLEWDFLKWPRFIHRPYSEITRPLHHLLIMQLLSGSAERFHAAPTEYNPAVNAYGLGPWPCINSACPEYGSNLASLHSWHWHRGTLYVTFKCPVCGMIYQRNNPNQSFPHYAQHAHKLEYGHVWEERVRKSIEEDNLSLSQIAHDMHCTVSTVRKAAERLGILHPHRP